MVTYPLILNFLELCLVFSKISWAYFIIVQIIKNFFIWLSEYWCVDGDLYFYVSNIVLIFQITLIIGFRDKCLQKKKCLSYSGHVSWTKSNKSEETFFLCYKHYKRNQKYSHRSIFLSLSFFLFFLSLFFICILSLIQHSY